MICSKITEEWTRLRKQFSSSDPLYGKITTALQGAQPREFIHLEITENDLAIIDLAQKELNAPPRSRLDELFEKQSDRTYAVLRAFLGHYYEQGLDIENPGFITAMAIGMHAQALIMFPELDRLYAEPHFGYAIAVGLEKLIKKEVESLVNDPERL